MKPNIETRTANIPVELRDVDSAPRLVGYAAVFNSRSENLGGFVEVIRPGAFRRSLAAGADVRATVNHNPDLLLGRNTASTLVIGEDERGLKIEITPPNTQAGRDVIESVRRGDLSGMSFAFSTPPNGDRWDMAANPPLRELLDVDLEDVSIVAYPAYPKTDVALRSLEAARAETMPETMDPDADGKCMDGYDMGEDGKCHLMSEADRAARASLDIRRRRLRLAGL